MQSCIRSIYFGMLQVAQNRMPSMDYVKYSLIVWSPQYRPLDWHAEDIITTNEAYINCGTSGHHTLANQTVLTIRIVNNDYRIRCSHVLGVARLVINGLHPEFSRGICPQSGLAHRYLHNTGKCMDGWVILKHINISVQCRQPAYHAVDRYIFFPLKCSLYCCISGQGTTVQFILAGYNCVLRILHVGINKPFKD